MSDTRTINDICNENIRKYESSATPNETLKKKRAFQLYYDDVKSLLDNFSPEEIGEIFTAVARFEMYGEEAKLSDRACNLKYADIVSALKRNNEKYLEACEKKRAGANERWRREKEKEV